MNKTVIAITRFAAGAFLAVVVAGCEAEKSRNPLSPNVAGPIAGVSISPPTPVNPVNAEVLNTGPLVSSSTMGLPTASARSSISSSSRPTPGSPTRCLPSPRSTQGRARRRASSLTPRSQPNELTTGGPRPTTVRTRATSRPSPSSISSCPSSSGAGPVSPVGGVVTSSAAPALVVNNAAVQGRAGNVDYWFEVALDQAFSRTIVALGVERSGGSTTSAQMPELPGNTPLYWRVVGIGLNGTVTGSWSATQSFRTPAAAPAPPPPGPSP